MDSAQIVKMNPKIEVITEESSKNKCDFCHKTEINDIEWGPMCKLEEIVVHYFCMLFSSALKQNGKDTDGILGFLPTDLTKEMKRGEKLKCRHCKLNRATVGCAVKQCKASFHFSCGIPHGALNQFSGSFSSYCSTHKPAIKIPIPPESWNCEICFLNVEPNAYPVWPPCCKRRVFHRSCIQSYAANSGYFFSCPCCKDKTQFIQAMKESGVYVPEQDATWELAPNAFAELNQMYSHCDAEECLCPQGRKYDCPNTRNWKMVRCNSCGSSAIHYSCGQLSLVKWKCPECVDVLTRDPSKYRMVVLEGASESDESDEDELSEDDDCSSGAFRTTDENVRIAIAARSCLTGLERDAHEVSSPTDYVASGSISSVSDDALNNKGLAESLKRLEGSKKIIYNRNFGKKYKVDIGKGSHGTDYDSEDDRGNLFATRRARIVSRYFIEHLDSNLIANSEGLTQYIADTKGFRDKLSKLRASAVLQAKCLSDSGNNCHTQPSELFHSSNLSLKSTCRVKNLDLSEHESKCMTKFVSLPSFSKAEICNLLSEDSKSRDCTYDLSDDSAFTNLDIHLAIARQTRNLPNPSFVVNRNSGSPSKPSNSDINKLRNDDDGPLKETINCVLDTLKEKLDEFDSPNELDDLFATKETSSRKELLPLPSTDNQENLDEHTDMDDKNDLSSAVLPETNSPTSYPGESEMDAAVDSEEVQITAETLSPKKVVVITLDDTVQQEEDDVEFLMEDNNPRNSINPFKQQGSWFPGCEKPLVKSSALMQVLKTEVRSINDEEVVIISDEDDYQQVTIQFRSDVKRKLKSKANTRLADVEIISIDDDDHVDCKSQSTSGKRSRNIYDLPSNKKRFGSFDFETRSSNCNQSRKRKEDIYRISTTGFTVEMNRPRLV